MRRCQRRLKGGIHLGFRPQAFCTVWSIEPKQNFTKVRLSISRKNRDTGEYEQDFSGFVMFIGHAHAKAQKLHERDRIRLGDTDVTTTYDRERNREYVNYKCFEFDFADEVAGPRPNADRTDANPVDGGEDVEEELPF